MEARDDRFGWTSDAWLVRILSALTKEGEAAFVGGCVRDSLLGLDPLTNDAIDIDIATDRTPDEMKAIFEGAGLRWIATGEEHGTITVVEDGLVAECTTYRADTETDGRHAQVRFTRDWNEDWRRRDFTINAIYRTATGELRDPAGGLADLDAGVVRFIGEADERIREDALRILRFFRFSARFAVAFDETALAAIEAKTDLLDILSKERIWSELRRTFAAEKAPEALEHAEKHGVLQHLVACGPRTDVFRRLHEAGAADVMVSVAAIWAGLSRDTLKESFKPSNEELGRYAAIEKARDAISAKMQAHELLYRFGRDASRDACALALAEGDAVDPGFVQAVASAPIPVLPYGGKDLIARGHKPGPAIGEALARFERLWLEDGAPTDSQRTEELLAKALGC
ncbi:CCA tRNA nucleotidyltransferase [Parvularcula sp. ZS-1/3]|uniref:CCA tRNA nucleotidyltransferase n=1 Tax=Parvularcula mediterranea TaxID=2732508 RepID=A0A7Y3RJE4_9PROT|nr:CCA tRNA nucleotidyltransferase [Parvularcula mediterranea]NNU15130.1 CCA tRNA nucleotidyltransferase [Parvularcula mediterranea]